MARTTVKKTVPAEQKITIQDVEEFLKNKKQCTCCGKILDIARNFYKSYSKVNKSCERISVCKTCLTPLIAEYIDECGDIKTAIYKTCRAIGAYFTEELFNQAYGVVGYNSNLGMIENGIEVWKEYIKNINSLPQNTGKSFDNGQQLNLEVKEETKDIKVMDENDLEKELEFQRNKADIIKMLGYYPFEGEDKQDLLCGQLITFLGDEDVKEDAIKLNAIISIIRTQRTVDILTKSLSDKTKDILKLDDNLGSIKQMSAIQKELSKAILDTAKDNKLTDLWSGKKTAGANSLTGTLYKLRQMNLDDAQVNLFDIRTSKGMEQVARQSAKGILDNLNWGDDVSMEMIKEQRVIIDKYYKLYISLKEENRKLKVLCNLNNVNYKQDNFIEEVEWEDIKVSSDLTREDVDKIIEENEIKLRELEELENSVKCMTVMDYANEVIEEENKKQKQKILDELNKK